jgi:hypothetical protein
VFVFNNTANTLLQTTKSYQIAAFEQANFHPAMNRYFFLWKKAAKYPLELQLGKLIFKGIVQRDLRRVENRLK